MPKSAAALMADLAQQGLVLRGVLRPSANDAWPTLASGESTNLWLVGAVGSSLWEPFRASPEYRDGEPHPLDRWSERIAHAWASRLGGLALFPFGGPPHWPFQRWADRAEPLTPSPLGMRLHPTHGLWHAYRFALVLPQRIAAPLAPAAQGDSTLGACSACPKHCVQGCPVGAHGENGFDLKRCTDHLRTPDGQVCLQRGCQARVACPVGRDSVYRAEHIAFHMQAFAHRHLAPPEPQG